MESGDYEVFDDHFESLKTLIRDEIRLGVRAVVKAVLMSQWLGDKKADGSSVWNGMLRAMMEDAYSSSDPDPKKQAENLANGEGSQNPETKC